MGIEPWPRRFFTYPISSVVLAAAPALVVIALGAVIGTWWSWLLAGPAVLYLGLVLLGAREWRSQETPVIESEWAKTALYLRGFRHRQAHLNADLLLQAEPRWSGKVVPRTSWIELLFTPLEDKYPFKRALYVSFNEADDAFTFQLIVRDLLITADKARAGNAPPVLDAFLMQLAQVTLPATDAGRERLQGETKFRCACCGYLTLDEEPHDTYAICSVCGWEDDPMQFSDPNYAGGANEMSLNEARRRFALTHLEPSPENT